MKVFLNSLLMLVQYVLVAITGSVLAFVFVAQFLTPAPAESPQKILDKTRNQVEKLNTQTANQEKKAKEILGKPNATQEISENKIAEKPQNEVPKDSTKTQETLEKPNEPQPSEAQPSEPQPKINPAQEDKMEDLETLKDSSSSGQESFLEESAVMTPFLYDASPNRRDPFENPFSAPSGGGLIETAVRTPPEQFDLPDINVKGILWDTKKPRALIQLPDGEFYTLLRGDKIGKTGIIFEIREDEIVILNRIIQQNNLKSGTETSISIKRIENRLGTDIQRLDL